MTDRDAIIEQMAKEIWLKSDELEDHLLADHIEENDLDWAWEQVCDGEPHFGHVEEFMRQAEVACAIAEPLIRAQVIEDLASEAEAEGVRTDIYFIVDEDEEDLLPLAVWLREKIEQ